MEVSLKEEKRSVGKSVKEREGGKKGKIVENSRKE